MNKLISSCKWYLLSTKNLPTIEQKANHLVFKSSDNLIDFQLLTLLTPKIHVALNIVIQKEFKFLLFLYVCV